MTKKYTIGGVVILAVLFSAIYLSTTYQNLDQGIDAIEITLNRKVNARDFHVYLADSSEVTVNFDSAYFSEQDSILLFRLKRKIRLREFRLYVQRPIEDVTISEIYLKAPDFKFKFDVNKLSGNSIDIKSTNGGAVTFSVKPTNGYSYFVSPLFYYPADYLFLACAITALILIAILVFLLLQKTIGSLMDLKSISIPELSVVLFIFCIFLPQAFSNITLAVSILLVARNFKMRSFLTSKLNLLFVAFYLISFFNFLIFTRDYNFSHIEKYTAFLILPFYVSCFQNRNLHVFFCISAFLIGLALSARALINISIFRNLDIISFKNFTWSIHPVYFSYLLAFSIVYVELFVESKYRYWLHLLLSLFLIFSGSKLVVVCLVIGFLVLQKKGAGSIALSLVIASLFLFAPLRERFVSVIGLKDLSIVSEKHISYGDDPRINGVTLRLILWQECMPESAKEFLFGNGAGAIGDRVLESRLVRRGLTSHLVYNAHNQYITSLFKTGLVGLVVLVTIVFVCFRTAHREKNLLLTFFTIIMGLAMLSESIFERSFGVTFFCLMILLLSKPSLSNGTLQKTELLGL